MKTFIQNAPHSPKKSNSFLCTIFLPFALLFTQAGLSQTPSISSDLNDFLKKVDLVRNPSDDFQMTIAVESEENNSLFEVFLKGKEKTMIVTKAPARDHGRNMLMLDRDFYAYIPNLKRAMRLSLAQKLSGQVSNGDIARTRWHGDYDIAEESREGDVLQLMLTANKKNLTYNKIRLWAKLSNAHPVRAEFLSVDGKTLLKKAFYEDFKQIAGSLRPTKIRIEDKQKKVSTIVIQKMATATLKDSFFTEQSMESLQ